MRYLFVIVSLKVGGAERSVSRLVNYLAGKGYDVHLLLREETISYELSPEVKVHVPTDWRSVNKLRKVITFRKRIRQMIKAIDPDVTVAYTTLYGALLASTFVNPLVVRLDVYPLTLRRWKQAAVLTFYNLPNVKKIVCLTSDTKDDLQKYFNPRKLTVVHNAALPAVPDDAPAEDAFSPPTARPYFVGIGRLVGTKGFDRSLRAYAEARAYEHSDFVIVGDGPEMDSLKALSTELGIDEFVHFAGYQRKPFTIIANALCLVHSSAREGFPNVFTEALSLGVPVIAMDCKTGPSEIIIPGENGFLVPFGDTTAMARKMSIVLEDAVLLGHLRRNATSSVDRFREEKVFADWEAVLRECLS